MKEEASEDSSKREMGEGKMVVGGSGLSLSAL